MFLPAVHQVPLGSYFAVYQFPYKCILSFASRDAYKYHSTCPRNCIERTSLHWTANSPLNAIILPTLLLLNVASASVAALDNES